MEAFSWVIFSNPTLRRKKEKEKMEKQKLRDFSSSISGWLPFQLSRSLSDAFQQLLFSWGDFSFSSSDAIKECTVISPAQPQQNKELQ